MGELIKDLQEIAARMRDDELRLVRDLALWDCDSREDHIVDTYANAPCGDSRGN